MAEFKAIESQEALDAIISERLKREKETVAKQYADYDEIKQKNEALSKQISEQTASIEAAAQKAKETETTIADLNTKVKTYETDSAKTRIAIEAGLPYELASRLSGENEEAIKKDAESLAKLVKGNHDPAPLAHPEGDPAEPDDKKAAMKKMLSNMKGEE